MFGWNAVYQQRGFGWLLFIGLAWGDLARAQEPPAGAQTPPVHPVLEEKTSKNVPAPCVELPPLVSLKDYNGPLKKTVGIFARALERKSVHLLRYKPSVVLCTLEIKDKFVLFVQDSFDPVTFLSAGFWACMDQAADRDPTFGLGAEGYGKRFAANFADQASSKFLKGFCLSGDLFRRPALLPVSAGQCEEALSSCGRPRARGPPRGWTHMLNYSEWLGTVSAVALSNTYHPGNERGVGPATRRDSSRPGLRCTARILAGDLPKIEAPLPRRKRIRCTRIRPAEDRPPNIDPRV